MDKARSFMEWARTNQNVKIITTIVPFGILPPQITGKIHDVRYFAKSKTDDDDNADLCITKGHCFIELDYNRTGVNTIQCVVRGFKKFTGNDDRDDANWREYFLQKSVNQTKDIVCTSKINGISAHIGSILIYDQIYICAGSQNVHMLFKNENQLYMYDSDNPRYETATEICKIVLEKFDISSKYTMYKFLLKNQYTAIFEYVRVGNKCLKFIAWTDCEDDTFVSMRPDEGIELAKSMFSFDTIDYKVINCVDLDKHIEQIRKTHGIESGVMYFVDIDGKVIGRSTKKSVWYIVMRVIREMLRNNIKKQLNVNDLNTEYYHKLVYVQNCLKFDDFNYWYTMGCAFFSWLEKQQTEHGIHEILFRYVKKFRSWYEEFNKTFYNK